MVRTSNVFSHMVLFMALFSFVLLVPRAVQCAEKWDNNRKQAESGKVESGGTWYAPFEKEIKDKFQTVLLGNAEITGNKGGTAKASYNKGIFGAGSIVAGIAGGFASVGKNEDTSTDRGNCNSYAVTCADASYNSVTMQSDSILASAYHSKYWTSYITATTKYSPALGTPEAYGYIYGGFAKLENSENDLSSATAKNNNIYIKNNSSENGLFPPEDPDYQSYGSPYTYIIIGGNAELRWGKGTSLADHNKVIFNADAKYFQNLDIVGGYAYAPKGYASASNNYVEIEKAGECSDISGGFTGISDCVTAVSGNKVYIKDGIIKEDVAGGTIDTMQTNGDPEYYKSVVMASNNVVELAGGSYEGDIFGVKAYIWPDTAIFENNKVILSHGRSMPKFSDKTYINGYLLYKASSVSKFSNNSLELRAVKGLAASNIKNFDKIIFELPDMKAEETILSLTGYFTSWYGGNEKNNYTDITDITVDVQKIGRLTNNDGGEFRVGDKVYLLKNNNGIKTKGCIMKTVPSIQGYTLEVRADDTSVYLTRIK